MISIKLRWSLLALIVAFLVIMIALNENREKILHYDILWSRPLSLDPMKYDYFVHHKCFTSVFSRLITMYGNKEIIGEVAESWSVDKEFKVWKFFLRKNLTFENGEVITAKHVSGSLKRIAFLMKSKNSKSGIFENIIGHESFNSLDGEFVGLKVVDDHEFWIELKTPQENLLKLISFGLYSVVHSNDYDLKTGAWKDPKKALSSSLYRVKKWDNDKLILSLREDVSSLWGHKKKFNEVYFEFNNENKKIDLVEGIETSNYGDDFKYAGNITSSIVFIRVSGYKNKANLLFYNANRKIIRSLLIDEYEKLGVKVFRSFFPVVMRGISEVQKDDLSSLNLKRNSDELRVLVPPLNSGIIEKSETMKMYLKVLKSVAKKMSLKLTLVEHDHTKNGVLFYGDHFDLNIISTAILVDRPDDDIKFMVNSKEGIRLPDPKGILEKETSKDRIHVDTQKINQTLWDDALVWGLSFRSQGLWFREDYVDVSELNRSMPLIDFNWIGRK